MNGINLNGTIKTWHAGILNGKVDPCGQVGDLTETVELYCNTSSHNRGGEQEPEQNNNALLLQCSVVRFDSRERESERERERESEREQENEREQESERENQSKTIAKII